MRPIYSGRTVSSRRGNVRPQYICLYYCGRTVSQQKDWAGCHPDKNRSAKSNRLHGAGRWWIDLASKSQVLTTEIRLQTVPVTEGQACLSFENACFYGIFGLSVQAWERHGKITSSRQLSIWEAVGKRRESCRLAKPRLVRMGWSAAHRLPAKEGGHRGPGGKNERRRRLRRKRHLTRSGFWKSGPACLGKLRPSIGTARQDSAEALQRVGAFRPRQTASDARGLTGALLASSNV
jgi:hypothetical protein